MITEVIMKREIFGSEISQKSKTEFLSATDLVMAGNKWRVLNNKPLFKLAEYFDNKCTKEFMQELSLKYGQIKQSSKGKGHHTWVHPYLFLDIALNICPTFKIEVYEWLSDNLLKYRNDSGDSHKKMSGFLFSRTKNKQNFWKEISDVSNKIKISCNVKDWENANEEQLKKRDRIHENICLLADVLNNNEEAVRLAILKSI